MKNLNPRDRKSQFIVIGVLLLICLVLSIILFLKPVEEPLEHKASGILLFDDGSAAKPAEIRLEGKHESYYFGNGDTVVTVSVFVDGTVVLENVAVTFDKEYGDTDRVVLSDVYDIAARVTVDGASCLLVAPATTEKEASNLLAFLQKSGAEWLTASNELS